MKPTCHYSQIKGVRDWSAEIGELRVSFDFVPNCYRFIASYSWVISFSHCCEAETRGSVTH